MSAAPDTRLARLNGPRWAFFMREAEISLRLASTAPTPTLRRGWLQQASSELLRADEASAVFRALWGAQQA